MRIILALLALVLSLLSSPAWGESCDTDCHRQCRIRTDFPPIEFIEPTCHAKCEVAKKAACAVGQPLPTIPVTPREQVEVYGNQACSAPFQAITNVVIAQCSNWDGRLEGQELIWSAFNRLVSIGAVGVNELNGVQVRWCPLSGAHGMAPDRGRIYLDVSIQNDAFQTASTLAHEIMHLRQYARAGSDRFKCEYSRAFAECGGCQDSRNSFENEAYQFESSIGADLGMSFQNVYGQPPMSPMPGTPNTGYSGIPVLYCQTPMFTCSIPPAQVPMGTPCYCNDGYGRQVPGTAF